MIGEHYSQTKARLVASTKLANKVDAAARQKDGLPVRANYVVLFPPSVYEMDDQRFTKGQDVNSDATYRYDAKAVAVDPDGVLVLVQEIFAQLIGWAPTIAGRICDPFELLVADKVRPDDSVSPPLFYCDLEFEAVSRRA